MWDRFGVTQLVDFLKSPSADKRYCAAYRLAESGYMLYFETALPALIGALGDEEASVRMQVVRALGRGRRLPAADAERRLKALTSALGDRSFCVRLTAAQTLGTMGGEAAGAVPALIASLSDASDAVRYFATEALQRIGEATKLVVTAAAE